MLINGCSQEQLNYNEGNTFLFSDNLEEKEFSKFVSDKKNLTKINDFINEIDKHETIKYHYSYLQPVGVEQKPKIKKFIYLYDEGFELQEFPFDNKTFYNVNSIQTDPHAIDLNNLVFSKGHGGDFTSKNVNSSTIPVVLGYNYNEFYQIGDTFNINYLLDTYEAEVIGILEKNQTMITSNEPDVKLDNYIILPKIDVSNYDIEKANLDNNDKRLSYISKITNQTHAILITTNSEKELVNELDDIEEKIEFDQYTISNLTNLIRD